MGEIGIWQTPWRWQQINIKLEGRRVPSVLKIDNRARNFMVFVVLPAGQDSAVWLADCDIRTVRYAHGFVSGSSLGSGSMGGCGSSIGLNLRCSKVASLLSIPPFPDLVPVLLHRWVVYLFVIIGMICGFSIF
jgi:hypothetical protein